MRAIPEGRVRRSFAAAFIGTIFTILLLEAGRRLGAVSPLVFGGVGIFLYLHASLAAALLLGAAAARDDGRPLWRRGMEAGLLLAAFVAALELTARATILGDVVNGYFGAMLDKPDTWSDVRVFELGGWLVALLFAWSLALGRLVGRPWLGAVLSVPAAVLGFALLALPGATFQNGLLFDGEVVRGVSGFVALWLLLAAMKARETKGGLRAPVGWLALSIGVCALVPVQSVMQVDSMLVLAHPLLLHRGDYYRALNARSPGVREGGGVFWSARGGAYRASDAAGELTVLAQSFEGSAFGLLAVPGPPSMEALWDDAGRLWTLRSAPAQRETVVTVLERGTVARRVYEDDRSYWGLSLRGGEAGVFRSAGGEHSFCALAHNGELGRCESIPGFENLDERLLEAYRAAGLTAKIDGGALRRERPGTGVREWSLPGAGLKDDEGVSFLVALRLRDRDIFAVPVVTGGKGAVALCESDGRVRVAWPGAFVPGGSVPRFDTLPDGTVVAESSGTLMIMDPEGRWLPAFDPKPALARLGYPSARTPRATLIRRAEGKLWIEIDGAFIMLISERGGPALRVDRLPPEGVWMLQATSAAAFLQTSRGAWRYDWDGRLTRLMRAS